MVVIRIAPGNLLTAEETVNPTAKGNVYFSMKILTLQPSHKFIVLYLYRLKSSF